MAWVIARRKAQAILAGEQRARWRVIGLIIVFSGVAQAQEADLRLATRLTGLGEVRAGDLFAIEFDVQNLGPATAIGFAVRSGDVFGLFPLVTRSTCPFITLSTPGQIGSVFAGDVISFFANSPLPAGETFHCTIAFFVDGRFRTINLEWLISASVPNDPVHSNNASRVFIAQAAPRPVPATSKLAMAALVVLILGVSANRVL